MVKVVMRLSNVLMPARVLRSLLRLLMFLVAVAADADDGWCGV